MLLNFLEKKPEGEKANVAFLTPKRLGPASIRNKLRRRMREIYRRYLQKDEEPNYLVWVARPPAVEMSFEELKTTMTTLRERVR